jgi:glutamate formiminotransferase/formiminotetrahydrofolate cyclodeaminase
MPLIECIPNVSDGRRAGVIAALANAVSAVDGIVLLDRTSDPSHDRSVLTFAGEPGPLEDAVLALAVGACEAIDLRTHAGVHPRIGALDVVPFVPLRDTTVGECVTLARRVGARLASTVGLPVFLYQQAATSPDRQRLEEIRRGGLAGLAERMRDGSLPPDFGPPAPHPTAGATVVGARGPLVAWNLNLATDDLHVARAIAREIRERHGGLPGLKALGLPLGHRGLAQVSMNLTDYRATPMHLVYARVAAAAERLGTRILESEIIGLVPRDALAETQAHAPELWDWHAHQILEDRLEARGL